MTTILTMAIRMTVLTMKTIKIFDDNEEDHKQPRNGSTCDGDYNDYILAQSYPGEGQHINQQDLI